MTESVTIDLDTTDVEVYGRQKRGIAFNHQGQRVGLVATASRTTPPSAVPRIAGIFLSEQTDVLATRLQLWDATHGASPNPEDVARWETALRGYVAERCALGLEDPGKLREVIEVRGAELRDLTGRQPGGTSD